MWRVGRSRIPYTPMNETRPKRFYRYVAIGDSSTEGLNDPDDRGGYRGWANRLADHVAAAQGELLYANLAVRGRRTRQILEQQLEPAVGMRPDLATIFAGTNDAVAGNFDVDSVAMDMETIQRTLTEGGATVLTFTLPDLTSVMPMARRIAPRVRDLNEMLRTVAASTGAILVDFARYPVAGDRRLWHEDRLHANSLGHERIAAALAHALDLPGSDDSWAAPLAAIPPPSLPRRLGEELRWGYRYFLPWVFRHLQGRSSGDGIRPKRPQLEAVEAPQESLRRIERR